MKQTKQMWFRAAAVVTLALCLFLGVRGLEKEIDAKPAKVSTVFHYDSEDVSAGAFADINNWEEGPAPAERPCGDGTNKPCTTVALDENDLATMLAGRSNSSILLDSQFTKRNKQNLLDLSIRAPKQ